MGVRVDSPRATRAVATRTLRAVGAYPNLVAALSIGAVVLAYLWPALVGGRLLAPLSSLYLYPPWRHTAVNVGGYFNPLLTDVPMVDYPWRHLVSELLHQGTFPAWNPYVLTGTPLFSNPQTGLFSLFDVPLWVLPFNWALGFSAALKLWVAGFGTYLLARTLRLGLLPALLAGVAFAFSSINILWLTHDTLPAVAALLPWTLLLAERCFVRGRLSDALWLAVATAIGLGGGHPGMQVHLLVVVGLYAVARAGSMRAGGVRERARPLALVGGGLVLGTLLMAAMLVPEALSSRGTVGTLARSQGELPGGEMTLGAIRTVLFPEWWGRPSGAMVPMLPNYNERTFYAGVVTLLIASVAFVTRDGWRRKAPFVLLVVVGLAVPLRAPGLIWLVTHLPLLDLVQPQRLHFVFELAIAVLAAFGLQALHERPWDRRWLTVPLGGIVIALVALAGTHATGADVSRVVRHFATGADFPSAGVLALTSVMWFALFLGGVTAALLALRRPQYRGAAAAAIVLLAVLDALHFAHGYQPMGPPQTATPPRNAAIAYLQRHAGEARVSGLEYSLGVDWGLTYGLRDVRGYDPPQPTQRYFELWRTVNADQVDWQPLSVDALSPDALNLMSVLGVRYVLAEAGIASPHDASPPTRALRRVYNGPDATIFRNARAVPRAYVAPAVELTDSIESTHARLVDPTFDPRRAVVVERAEPGVASLAGGSAGSARVVRDGNASVTLQATLARRGIVVLDDQYTDGWSVRVDGRAATPLHVDAVMRGVAVPAGRHSVVWSYRVPGLRAGAALSAVALALVLSGAAACLLRRRRRDPPPGT